MTSEYLRPSLRDDPRLHKALLDMPSKYADSYSESQLIYFRLALIGKPWQQHFIDNRGTFYFPFIGWRFFYVFLLGRNKRALNRKEKQASMAVFLLSLVGFIVLSMVIGLLLLYLLKSALGIDLFEGTSLGIWDWFNE